MKKPNISLNQKAIKDFFFRHSEKLFFLLSIGLIAFFFWLGFKTPKYDDTTPAAMWNTSQRANDYIHDSENWSRLAEHRVPITDAAEQINNQSIVDSHDFPIRHVLGTGYRTLEKRTDPAFLIPGELVTRYFRAQIMVKVSSKGNEDGLHRASALNKLPKSNLVYPAAQKAESFVYRVPDAASASYVTRDGIVGMALIDFESQLEAYRDTFQYQRAFDPDRDQPRFAFIEVQRKTVDSEWTPISVPVYDNYNKMADPAKDVIPNDLVIENVTLAIPPILGADYREFATVDEMKAITIEQFLREKREKEKLAAEEAENADDDEEPGDFFASGSGNNDSGKSKKKKSDDDPEEEQEVAKYRLIRSDLDTKETGVEYSYRVRLWFFDPNNVSGAAGKRINKGGGAAKGPDRAQGGGKIGTEGPAEGGGGGGGGGGGKGKKKKRLAPLFRDDLSAEVRRRQLAPIPDVSGLPSWIEDQKERVLRTVVPGKWIESVSPIKVTRGFETFVAGPVSAPTPNRVNGVPFYDSEPEATVVANSFQDDLGVFVPASTSIKAGSLMNFRAVTNLLHPVTLQIKEVFETEQESRRGSSKIGRRFETDAVLIDMMGGERQPFSRRPDLFFAPGEILILDRNGHLVVRNELDDETAFRHSMFISNINAPDEEADDDDDEDSF